MPAMKKQRHPFWNPWKNYRPAIWICCSFHQPFGDYYGTYRAMKELYKAGKLRAIGVSNFGPDRYLDIQHFATVKPAVNQIETHVFQQQKVAREYLQKYNCQPES